MLFLVGSLIINPPSLDRSIFLGGRTATTSGMNASAATAAAANDKVLDARVSSAERAVDCERARLCEGVHLESAVDWHFSPSGSNVVVVV